jgi:hypothetical protein
MRHRFLGPFKLFFCNASILARMCVFITAGPIIKLCVYVCVFITKLFAFRKVTVLSP